MTPVRVLLVDDESAIQVVLEEYFAGREDMALCAVARDGLEGLELIYQQLPDVVLLDLIMPGLDGLCILEALRDRPPEKPPAVVITSQVGEPRLISHCLSLGARYYLIKPLALDQLAELICGLCHDALEARARSLLLEMGAPESSLGLIYASSAAAAMARESGRLLLKEAYYDAIIREQTSYACVEKNIRTMTKAIHEAARPAYCALFGEAPRKRPTNEAFLRRLAAKLRE